MKTYKISPKAGLQGDGKAFADIAEGLAVSIRYIDGRNGTKIEDAESFAKKNPDYILGFCRDGKFCIEPVKKNIALIAIVQARLKKLGMSVKDLERCSGVLDQSIYDWFKGRHELGAAKLEKILNALDLEVRPRGQNRLALAASKKGR